MIAEALVLAALAAFPTGRALTPARAHHIAADIAAEVDTVDEMRALVATATIESGLREAVETCKVTGDHGRAWSLYQLNAPAWKLGHSRAEICSSNRLATRLALRALRSLGGSAGHWENAMRLYVGKSTSPRDSRVRARCRLFRRLCVLR